MKFVAEYIWLGGKNELRSKSKTMNIPVTQEEVGKRDIMKEILSVSLYEDWNYDGSSTFQMSGKDSEVIIKPVAVYLDPFRKAPNVFVLCDTYYPDDKPMPSNHRYEANKIFNQKQELVPMYGLEQEFFLMRTSKKMHPTQISTKPLGWKKENTEPQGQYYCSSGSNNAFGRDIAEQAYHLCLEANLTVSGMNAEVAPGQWEIQIGPCVGINAGDQMVVARYILNRVAELHNVQVNLEPKPVKGDWNGSGCHVNFSTKSMRDSGGIKVIMEAIEKLSKVHEEHMKVYGTGNEERMTGEHETAKYDEFTYGVANRGASVRIPRTTEKNGKGYFEDRRPSSNMDPYLVTSKIFETTSL